MRNIDAADVMGVVGLALVAIGLAFYDWRLAMVVVGTLLLGLALAGTLRG